MSKHKHTTLFSMVIVAVTIMITIAFLAGPHWGLEAAHSEPAYATKLFDTGKVHTIDIVAEEADWEEMLANAEAEEYIQRSVVIDGDYVKGVGIRPKGNSSLSMVAKSDSDRYSFKIEFDQYENGKNYLGLDKLVLNNIVQDNTYMKDYTAYQMMNAMGADAPLSSFIWVTVNGEDWGLYLAVEGVEESFAQRVYGNNYGQIYKPDTMDMNNVEKDNGDGFTNFDDSERPNFGDREMPDFVGREMPDFDGEMPDPGKEIRGFGGKGFGDMGNGATSLIYIDDNPDSYSAIFDNSKFKPSEAEKKRLIASLKQLNEGENIEEVVDVDEVIRYFVAHNFALNSDSYTGNLVHNYYLAENDGRLSMIAWDYNLAFGGMGNSARSLVNYPIDSPMLAGTVDDKPMIAWIFDNEEYLAKYHEIFSEFMAYFDNGEFIQMYDSAMEIISPYVGKDPTAFCTYEEFQKGSSTLREFCLLRAESIKAQLGGIISSTQEGQADSGNAGFINDSNIDLQSMGSNSMGFDRAREGKIHDRNKNNDGEVKNKKPDSDNYPRINMPR